MHFSFFLQLYSQSEIEKCKMFTLSRSYLFYAWTRVEKREVYCNFPHNNALKSTIRQQKRNEIPYFEIIKLSSSLKENAWGDIKIQERQKNIFDL